MNRQSFLPFIFLLFLLAVASFLHAGNPISFGSSSGSFMPLSGGTMTGNIVFGDGTFPDVGTYAFRFKNDPDTYCYTDSANSISFMTGGSRKFFANANAFYVDANLPITGPSNATGVFYIPTGVTNGKGMYTWKLDSNATIRYVGLGPVSATNPQPGMFVNNGTANPTTAQEWGSTTTTINSYTKLGELSPGIKCKQFTGTTGSDEGGVAEVAHGLGNKILFVVGYVTGSDGVYYPPEHTYTAEALYSVRWGSTNLQIINSATNSGIVASQAYKMLAFYAE